jgi:hypothetical protein
MRWLFIGVLGVLVALILSIGWMNDPNRGPRTDIRVQDGQVVPIQ